MLKAQELESVTVMTTYNHETAIRGNWVVAKYGCIAETQGCTTFAQEDQIVTHIIHRLDTENNETECIIESRDYTWYVSKNDPEKLASFWGLNRLVVVPCQLPWLLPSCSDDDSRSN